MDYEYKTKYNLTSMYLLTSFILSLGCRYAEPKTLANKYFIAFILDPEYSDLVETD